MRKIALITGASSGIGEATARKLASSGWDLILAARRYEHLQKLAAQLECEWHLIRLDVRQRSAVEDAMANLPEQWKNIELLVNNAGLSRQLTKLHEGDPEAWDEMIDTNVKGLLYVSRAVIPGMVARGRGHVINVGSIAGHEVYPNGNVYCASKFAVDALTKGMMMDLVDTQVRVSTVDPGLVETEFSKVRFYGDKERADKVYQGLKPLTGDDVAETIEWIASRPDHIQIAQVVIFPMSQAGATVVHRKQ
ncbi:MAG: SDR family oxidoreductase [Candidatus Zixiibacteriota bacterium]